MKYTNDSNYRDQLMCNIDAVSDQDYREELAKLLKENPPRRFAVKRHQWQVDILHEILMGGDTWYLGMFLDPVNGYISSSYIHKEMIKIKHRQNNFSLAMICVVPNPTVAHTGRSLDAAIPIEYENFFMVVTDIGLVCYLSLAVNKEGNILIDGRAIIDDIGGFQDKLFHYVKQEILTGTHPQSQPKYLKKWYYISKLEVPEMVEKKALRNHLAVHSQGNWVVDSTYDGLRKQVEPTRVNPEPSEPGVALQDSSYWSNLSRSLPTIGRAEYEQCIQKKESVFETQNVKQQRHIDSLMDMLYHHRWYLTGIEQNWRLVLRMKDLIDRTDPESGPFALVTVFNQPELENTAISSQKPIVMSRFFAVITDHYMMTFMPLIILKDESYLIDNTLVLKRGDPNLRKHIVQYVRDNLLARQRQELRWIGLYDMDSFPGMDKITLTRDYRDRQNLKKWIVDTDMASMEQEWINRAEQQQNYNPDLVQPVSLQLQTKNTIYDHGSTYYAFQRGRWVGQYPRSIEPDTGFALGDPPYQSELFISRWRDTDSSSDEDI